ncbi:mitochondrial sodium/hydrogen exchanger NHA2 [Trypanosoma grayi]|uniref:mitochondrial sodium/hydrogen exchanger NHA2 n=1 Tax=Trypanosoma grayi TaxID=71804 RepID=UPI0004F47FA8|nr:mitochondrial sodium/hydrogen exchanger NHA2 [Trypanosoma grayi]KEG07339.1 mitochondrial sodium/hydrogen exchanger NHA2 [Trypanosoma grayi]
MLSDGTICASRSSVVFDQHEPRELEHSRRQSEPLTHDAACASGASDCDSGVCALGDVVQRSPESSQRGTVSPLNSILFPPVPVEDIECEKKVLQNFYELSSDTGRRQILHELFNRHFQPFERSRSFTAETWDEVKRMEPSGNCFDVQYDRRRYCFYITVARRRFRFFLWSFLFRLFCLLLMWVFMYCLVSAADSSPGGVYFDTATTILFSGVVGTLVSRLVRVPALVGVVAAGILYNNVPSTGYLTSGVTPTVRLTVGIFGLSVGAVRAGLSLNVPRFKQKFKHYMLFSILPATAEAIVHGFVCKAVFGFPNYAWAMIEGFVVSAIAPSVVVPVLIELQGKGYGTRDGPAMLVLSSIAVDTTVCVWVIQFLLATEFNTMSVGLAIGLAPVQLVVGLGGGVLLGFLLYYIVFGVLFMEGERIVIAEGVITRMTARHAAHVRYMSAGFVLLLSLACVSGGRRVSCLGGGAVAVIALAGTFNLLCERQGTPDHLGAKADMVVMLTKVWDYVAMPGLFGFAGASVNVHEVFSPNFIGRGCGVIFAGMAARFLFAMLTPLISRMGFTWREILFCGLGWLGKGSVQGALGPAALLHALDELSRATTPEEVARAQQRVQYGHTIKNTAVLSMLIACPLCAIFLANFSHLLLKKDPDATEPAAVNKKRARRGDASA